MKRRNWFHATLLATGLVCLSVPLNMGGCAGDVGQGISSIGSATGHGAPSGTENYLRAGEKGFQATSLSERDEDAMGQSVAVTLTNQYGLNDDESLARY